VILRVFRILQIIILALLVSCRAARPPASATYTSGSAEAYLSRYKDIAISEMRRTGVPASIKLAQGIIESNYGRSTLAREANNHFGIKCHNDWRGPTIRHNDDKRNECFRRYRTPEESFYDHSDFLKRGSRYSFLFHLDPTDYRGWASGLKKAGYATNPHYDNMLIRKIEELNLHQYDLGYAVASSDVGIKATSTLAKAPQKVPEKSGKASSAGSSNTGSADIPVSSTTFTVTARAQRVMENNRLQYVIVRDGDTFESLALEFQLLRHELIRFNELSEGSALIPGQILYLQPKRTRAEQGKDYHLVEQGETMHSVSQKYGIRLKSLYDMNRLDAGAEPSSGQRLWLRTVKPLS
jgi:LysM repeat protein